MNYRRISIYFSALLALCIVLCGLYYWQSVWRGGEGPSSRSQESEQVAQMLVNAPESSTKDKNDTAAFLSGSAGVSAKDAENLANTLSQTQ